MSATRTGSQRPSRRAIRGSRPLADRMGRIRGLVMWTSRRVKCTSASPAVSTFWTQSAFPWPNAIASNGLVRD